MNNIARKFSGINDGASIKVGLSNGDELKGIYAKQLSDAVGRPILIAMFVGTQVMSFDIERYTQKTNSVVKSVNRTKLPGDVGKVLRDYYKGKKPKGDSQDVTRRLKQGLGKIGLDYYKDRNTSTISYDTVELIEVIEVDGKYRLEVLYGNWVAYNIYYPLMYDGDAVNTEAELIVARMERTRDVIWQMSFTKGEIGSIIEIAGKVKQLYDSLHNNL